MRILKSKNVHPYICPEKEQNGVTEVRNRSISTTSLDFDQKIRKNKLSKIPIFIFSSPAGGQKNPI